MNPKKRKYINKLRSGIVWSFVSILFCEYLLGSFALYFLSNSGGTGISFFDSLNKYMGYGMVFLCIYLGFLFVYAIFSTLTKIKDVKLMSDDDFDKMLEKERRKMILGIGGKILGFLFK